MIITDSSLSQVSKELINKRTYQNETEIIKTINGESVTVYKKLTPVGNIRIIDGIASNFSSTAYLKHESLELSDKCNKYKIECNGVYTKEENTNSCLWCLHSSTPTITSNFSLRIIGNTVSLYYGSTNILQITNIAFKEENSIQTTVSFYVNTDKSVTYSLFVVVNDKSYTNTTTIATEILFSSFTTITVGVDETENSNNFWRGNIDLASLAIFKGNKIIYTPSSRNMFKFTKIMIGDGTIPLTDNSVEVKDHVYECPITEISRTYNNILLTAYINEDAYLLLNEIGLYYTDDTGSHIFSKIGNINVRKSRNLGYNLVIHVKLDINVVNTIAFPEIIVKKSKNPPFADFLTIKQVFSYITMNMERMIRLNALGIGQYTGGSQSTSTTPAMTDIKPVGVGYNKAQVMYRFLKEISSFQDNCDTTDNYAKILNKYNGLDKFLFDETKVDKIGSVEVYQEGVARNFSSSSYVKPYEEYYIPTDSSWEYSTAFQTSANLLTNQSIVNLSSLSVVEPLTLGIVNNNCYLSLGRPDELTLADENNNEYTYSRRSDIVKVNGTDYFPWYCASNTSVNLHTTITGSFTINNGVVSGFSASNSITTSKKINPLNSSWTLIVACRTGANITDNNYQTIAATGGYGIQLTFRSSGVRLGLSSDGSNWDINSRTPINFDGFEIQSSHNYIFELSYDSASKEYSLNIQDLENYTIYNVLTIESEKTILISDYLRFGKYGTANAILNGGQIDFKSCSFSVNGETVWSGTSSLSTVLTEDYDYINASTPPTIYDIEGYPTSLSFVEQSAGTIINQNLFPVKINTKYFVKIDHEGTNYTVSYSENNKYFKEVASTTSSYNIPSYSYAYYGVKNEDNSIVNPFSGSIYLNDTILTYTTTNTEGIISVTSFNFLKNVKKDVKLLNYFHIPEYAYSHNYFNVVNLCNDKEYLNILEGSIKGNEDSVNFGNPLGFSLVIKAYLKDLKNKVILNKGNLENNELYLTIKEEKDNPEDGITNIIFSIKVAGVDKIAFKKELNVKEIRGYTEKPIILTITCSGTAGAPVFKMYKNTELISTYVPFYDEIPSPPDNSYLTNRTSLSAEEILDEQIIYDILSFEGELKEDDIFFLVKLLS